VAKSARTQPFDKSAHRLRRNDRIGAVINTAKVEPGAKVVVFGLGGIGLNVVQGCRMVGADMIVGVDINPRRRALAEQFGMTISSTERSSGDLVPYLVDLTKGGPITALNASAMFGDDAPGIGMHPSRLGGQRHHRRRASGGDQHAALSVVTGRV